MDSTHETTAELFTSRPAPEERLEKELLCYDLLEKYKIPYTGLDHPAAMSVEDCHNADVLLGIHICKNLFLCNRQKTDFYLLLMPGDKVFKTKQLSAQIHTARLSFASPDYMQDLLNLTPGSVTIMGLMFDPEKKSQAPHRPGCSERRVFWLSSLHQYFQSENLHERSDRETNPRPGA